MAGVMSPYDPHAGAEGAVSGLLAVSFMELEQSWSFVRNRWLQLFELMLTTLFFILLGTLPIVEVFNIFTGFVLGIFLGAVVLPYINFGNWSSFFRRVLLIVSVPILMFLTVIIFYMFYELQDVSEKCGNFCQYVDCISYATHLCDVNDLP